MSKKKAKKKTTKKIVIRVRIIPLKDVPIPKGTDAPAANSPPKIAKS